MMQLAKLRTLIALTLAAALISACGGGAGEPPPPPVGTATGPGATPDTAAPSVTIASDVSAPVATGPVTFTFVFNEDVGVSFTAEDIVVTGGTKGTFNRVSGSQATLVVTPPANATGTVQVSVPAGQFIDIAGNVSTLIATATKNFNTVAAGPATAAPTPPVRVASDVLSVYSDAYTRIAGVDLFPPWGQSTVVTEVLVEGNRTQKYTNLNYEGIDWAGSPINVSSMTKLHVDLWTADVTSVKLSIISAGAENAVTLTPTLSAWSSFDIDLTQYTVPNKAAIIQVKFEGLPAGGTLYVDNLYFWKPGSGTGGGAGSCGTTAPTCAPTTTIPSGATVVYSETAAVAGFNPFPNWGQATLFSEANIAGNRSLKYTNLNYEGLGWEDTPLNVSSQGKLHLDFWTPDLSSVQVSIISAGKENAYTQPLTRGSWNSVDIDLSNYTVPDLRAIIQIKLEATGSGTLYVDNIYFWGAAATGGGGAGTCGTTAPTCAPTTTIPAGATVVYSEAASVPGFNPFPNWGQATLFSEANIAGNRSLKYTNLNYEGLGWEDNPLNVSSKGKLHLDFWTPDLTSVKVSVISAGKENAYTQTLTPGSWNSADIDLSNYTVPNLSAVIQIKLEATGSGTLYVDNIYFWGTAATGGGSGPAAEMGAGGAVTIAVASACDSFAFLCSGDAIFASDYIGPVDSLGNHALFEGATTRGASANGTIGFYNDTALSTSAQKVEEGGWVSGAIDNAGGVPNFFRYFVVKPPATTFASSYMGLYANSPNNGTVNVGPYASIKFKLWGPAPMYEQGNFNPVLEVILAGPKVAGCTATGSGGTEISRTFTANQKIGAGSSYKLALSGFTVKGLCGTDTNATAVASVLARLARVVVNLPGSSFNFTNANTGSPVTYSMGLNLGPIGFTNN